MSLLPEATIAAVTTPPGRGGISVVEIHGPEAHDVIRQIFHPVRKSGPALLGSSGLDDPERQFGDRRSCEADLSNGAPRSKPVIYQPLKLYRGVIHRDGRVIDDVLIRLLSPDQSFTGWPSVEVHGHGGPAPVAAILNLLERLSVPRVEWPALIDIAYRNGRIDRIQAEAHRLLPGALTPLAAMMLNDQAGGALSRAVRELRTREDVDRLLESAPLGCALASPLRIVIAGRPNVGKSTLLNALLEYERALVYPEAGTTRDPVTATTAIEGVPATLVDTAGIHTPKDAIDAEGIRRAQEELALAGLVLMVLEAGVRPDADERALMQSLDPGKRLIVSNKCDLAQASEGLPVSALRGTGLPGLRKAILDGLGLCPSYHPGTPVVFTPRQRDAMLECRDGPAELPRRLL